MSLLIYGRNTCQEVLSAKRKIYHGYFLEETNHDLVSELKRDGIPYEILDKSAFRQRFDGNHQGVVFEVEDYELFALKPFLDSLDLSKNPFLVMLDHVTDVHNLGAIIRSCEAGGVAGIIIPKKRTAKINSVVAKTSSGAIEYVKLIEVANLANSLKTLKEYGFWTVGTDLKAEKSYQEIFVDAPLCLVIGSEGKGISRIVKERVDYNVKIDMVGKTNSLNASVSAGILIFDILRKKLMG